MDRKNQRPRLRLQPDCIGLPLRKFGRRFFYIATIFLASLRAASSPPAACFPLAVLAPSGRNGQGKGKQYSRHPPPVLPLYRAGQGCACSAVLRPFQVTWRAAPTALCNANISPALIFLVTAAGLPITRGGAGDVVEMAGSQVAGGGGTVEMLAVGKALGWRPV